MPNRESEEKDLNSSPKQIRVGEGRTSIQVTVKEAGSDLVVVFTGGTDPHVGAVAIGVPIPRRSDPTKYRASISVHTIPPHREDQIVHPAAERLVSTLIKTTVVIAGIHIDDPHPQELQQIMQNCMEGINRVIEHFQNDPL